MLCPIIITRAVCSGNRYRYINLINRLITISNFKCYCTKVRIVISKHVRSKAHVCGSEICPRSLSGPRKCDIRIYIIKSRVGSGSITGYGMLLAIIIIRAIITGNRYRYINRVDLLITINYIKGNLIIIKVRIVIRKHGCSKTHAGSSGISTLRFCSSAKRKVCRSIKIIIDGHLISGHTMLFSIIVRSTIVTGNRYNNLILILRNRLITIRNGK